jgi:hypothetical protein
MGTAFFVSIPADLGVTEAAYVYLVTAKHCVEKAKRYGSLFIRINVKGGSVEYLEIKDEWTYNDDEGSDVAVLPFSLPDNADCSIAPVEMLATDEIIEEKRIGVGDDVVVTGLFTKRSGQSKNIPILRSGMIAAMPGEPLVGEGGEEYRAYLIET